MILIFLFLMAHNIEHLFVCLFVIRMSLVKCQFFCPFFKLDFFNVEFREFFMYSKYNLLDTWFTNIYLIFSFNSSFHFLKRILLRKKQFLILLRYSLSMFPFMDCALVSCLSICLALESEDFFLRFFSMSFIVFYILYFYILYINLSSILS